MQAEGALQAGPEGANAGGNKPGNEPTPDLRTLVPMVRRCYSGMKTSWLAAVTVIGSSSAPLKARSRKKNNSSEHGLLTKSRLSSLFYLFSFAYYRTMNNKR